MSGRLRLRSTVHAVDPKFSLSRSPHSPGACLAVRSDYVCVAQVFPSQQRRPALGRASVVAVSGQPPPIIALLHGFAVIPAPVSRISSKKKGVDAASPHT